MHGGSNPWEREAAPITAILVGKSGAGKSTLGNKLLNARLAPEEAKSYFREGGGSAGVTGRVDLRVSTDGRMKVIDTPGIPDPDSSKTIANFDTVVQTMRDEPAVNLLIFVVSTDRTDEYITGEDVDYRRRPYVVGFFPRHLADEFERRIQLEVGVMIFIGEPGPGAPGWGYRIPVILDGDVFYTYFEWKQTLS